MPANGYVSVTLRKEIIAEVKNEMKKHPTLYRSIADFVTDAVREKLQELRAVEVRE